jgi:hypothetical protein
MPLRLCASRGCPQNDMFPGLVWADPTVALPVRFAVPFGRMACWDRRERRRSSFGDQHLVISSVARSSCRVVPNNISYC